MQASNQQRRKVSLMETPDVTAKPMKPHGFQYFEDQETGSKIYTNLQIPSMIWYYVASD